MHRIIKLIYKQISILIGLQLNAEDVWKLFAAVTIHECSILFCIGSEMISGGTKRLQIIFYMMSLALITPIE